VMGDRNVDYNVLERILTRSDRPRDLPLEILKSITADFSEDNKIGRGGFSDVYKVKLFSSRECQHFTLLSVSEPYWGALCLILSISHYILCA